MNRLSTVLLSASLVSGACAAGRPPVDPEAIRETQRGHPAVDRYASSRAYLHYLNGRVAEHAANYEAAIAELKLAIVYDDEAADLRVALGWLYARVNALEKAEAEAHRAVQLDRRSHEAHLLLGKIHAAQRRHEAAAAELEQAIALQPSDEEAYLTLVRLLAEAGELARAEAVANRLSRNQPNEAEPWRLLARTAFDRGDATAGERLLRAAVSRDPWDFPSLLRLASVAESRGRRDDAQADYDAILRREPEHAEALLGAARLALGRGDESSARAYLGQLLGTAGDSRDVRLRAALAWFSARHYPEALLLLDEAERLAPGDPRPSYYRALVLESERRYSDALVEFLKVPRDSAELYAGARARAANCASLSGQHRDALRLLREALAEVAAHRVGDDATEVLGFVPDVFRRAGKPEDGVTLLQGLLLAAERPELVVILARALADAGRGPEAIGKLGKALDAHPGDERLTFALATLLDRAGNVEAAVALVRRLLQGDPDNASAMNFIGYVYADRGIHLDEARDLLRRAIQLRPDEGAILDSVGWLHLKRGDAREAVGILEKADTLSPGDPEILTHLGEAYSRAGRKGDAIEAWSRALKELDRDPNPRVREQVEGKLKRARAGSASR